MYRRYRHWRKSRKRSNGGAAVFLTLLFLGWWNFYRDNPDKLYLHLGYLALAIVSFFIIRHFIRSVRIQKGVQRGTPIVESDTVAELSKPVIGQTKEARLLWGALKERGVQGITEYPDGHKHVDIAILPAKLYIEVDGIQHFRNLNQVMADLKRDDYSEQDGFRTIRISNEAIRQDINMVADEIVRQIRERR